MQSPIKIISIFLLLIICTSCIQDKVSYQILVSNKLNISRTDEIVEVWFKDLSKQKGAKEYQLLNELGEQQRIQYVDIDSDQKDDYLIFKTNLNPKETKKFSLILTEQSKQIVDDSLTTYCRIVPERMDDFAWENDKVAFRSYGPKCQQLFEDGDATGLISSGIDCWTKKVNYPIIDKWYKNAEKGLSYHTDHGEGLDNYHVGTTRGCGGNALVYNDKNLLSDNFISWKIIANGPIRSIFELEYSPVVIDDTPITETKRISLDLGTQLYQCEVLYTSNNTVAEEMFMGLALHEGKGKINSNKSEGWVTYWEPMGNSFLGTAVLTDPNNINKLNLQQILHVDESKNNIGIQSRIVENKVIYWSGFGWKKTGDFETSNDWNRYVQEEATKKRNPLEIKISSN